MENNNVNRYRRCEHIVELLLVPVLLIYEDSVDLYMRFDLFLFQEWNNYIYHILVDNIAKILPLGSRVDIMN